MSLDARFVFQPSKHPVGDWNPVGLAFEDASFQTADGVRLHGWYCPVPEPRAHALLTHGNGGNVTHRAAQLRALVRLGCAPLILDYRGYGRSEGVPSEAGILADARAGRRWLAERAGIAESAVVLMGSSLGGGVAVDLAANNGCRGLVLENTFTSLPDAAARLYPGLPVRLLMTTRLDSLAKIGRYRGPLLQRHGTADRTIAYDLGRRLFEAANEPKRLVTVEGGGHLDPPPPAWTEALDQFLADLPSV